MGAAAVPIQIGLMVASTAVAVKSSQAQASAVRNAAAEKAKQASQQAKEAEIERLRKFRQTLAQNVASQAAGGSTFEGTPSQIIAGNISAATGDVTTIRGMGASAVRGYQAEGAYASEAGKYGMAGALAAGGAGIAGSIAATPSAPKTTSKI